MGASSEPPRATPATQLELAGCAVEAAAAVGYELNRYSLEGLVRRCPSDLNVTDAERWMREQLIPQVPAQLIRDMAQ